MRTHILYLRIILQLSKKQSIIIIDYEENSSLFDADARKNRTRTEKKILKNIIIPSTDFVKTHRYELLTELFLKRHTKLKKWSFYLKVSFEWFEPVISVQNNLKKFFRNLFLSILSNLIIVDHN
ncbi:hypothetical protein P5V15_006361 [Pogonomyrmex californicus]